MKNKLSCVAALAFSMSFPLAAKALDGMSVEGGGGNGVDVWRVGAQWKWDRKWFTGGTWQLGAYWDLQLGQWRGASTITDISLTPTFRFEASEGRGPYVEGAIGFHYLSGKNITSAKQFSTNFQFGDHVGAGYRFGEKGRYDLGLRIQHVSNGSIKKPNPGINFTLVRFQYHFR